MPNLHYGQRAVNVHAILEAAGFRVRGSRATCPNCDGHRQLTVAIRGELFYCHRCQRGGNVRALARRQGVSLPAPRIKKTEIPKAQFRKWLAEKMTTLANEERKAYRKFQWAQAALAFDPNFEPAWEFLAWFYARRPIWEQFWESAVDRIGRFHLYRAWRKYG